jgi:hypothetical protein
MRLAIEAAKFIKKSYDQDVHNLDQKQVFTLKIYRYKSMKSLTHHRKPKGDRKRHTPKRPEIVLKHQKISASNTQENALMKLMQESFTRFETFLSKQAEQMSTLMNLLTTVLSKLIK